MYENISIYYHIQGKKVCKLTHTRILTDQVTRGQLYYKDPS